MIEYSKFRVLVVGCGSIGLRHARNLLALGVQQLAVCDTDPERVAACRAEIPVPSYADLGPALQQFHPEVALICTPPVYHLEQALAALRAGAHVFIEKPVAECSRGLDELMSLARSRKLAVQVGYNLRFHPGLVKLKELIDHRVLGPVLWLRAEAGQYLPDWRPDQDYRQSYSARRGLGGGILLDGSHELDYILWLLGDPSRVICQADHVSSLEVDVEDSATLLLQFPGRVRAELHLDFVQRSYTRNCKVVGELGTALWDFSAREVRWFLAADRAWQSWAYEFEANDMYQAELRHFFQSLEQGTIPMVDLEQAGKVVMLVEAAKVSSEEGRVQELHFAPQSTGGVVAIIQARMGSSRLPGKTMADVEGRPMLWHVVERVRQARQVDRVVVATSTAPADDLIASFCAASGIACRRGSEADVLDRYYHVAGAENADTVVRITADCPLIDPAVIDRVVERFRQGGVDYVSNAMVRTFPDGLDAEAFSFDALETAWREARKNSEREHVTPYLRSGKFRTANVSSEDISAVSARRRWTVDEAADLAFVRAVYAAFRGQATFATADILRLLQEQPHLETMNQAVVSNEGYYRSLYTDAGAGAAPALKLAQSVAWMERASQVIPGSAQTFSKSATQHVRGVAPLFLARGQGSRVWDVDGNSYVDYIQGLLPNILGYAHEEVNTAVARQLAQGHSFSLPHPVEVELAERLVRLIPCAEMVRFGKNGSDATSGAVRAARAATGRDRIACCGYHGWQDWFIGSTARNAGVPGAVRELTHPFVYNDLASLERVLGEHAGEFAAVILEPVNFFPPADGYLQGVKDLAHRHKAILIFDEICSGFHFGLGGAQKFFGVTPDMACFGKAMGNGFPIACVVGRADLMKVFEEIFFSFTFGGETASMAAAMKVLDILERTDALARMEANGRVLQEGLNAMAKEAGLQERIKCIGYPIWSLIKFLDAEGKDSFLVRSLFSQECVKRGVLSLVTHNMTAAHGPVEVEETLRVYANVCKTLAGWLSDARPERFLEGAIIQPVFRVR